MTEPDPTPRRPRLLRRIAWAFAAVILGLGAYYGYWAVYGHRLVTIEDDLVYQSAQIPPDELVEIAADLGLRSVIDFRDVKLENVEAERAALTAAGIVHHHLPSMQEPTQETILKFFEIADDPDNFPLLIHCEHGEGRSVLFAALWRIGRDGWTNEQAWVGASRVPSGLKLIESVIPGLGGVASFSRNGTKGRILLGWEPDSVPPPGPDSPGDGR